MTYNFSLTNDFFQYLLYDNKQINSYPKDKKYTLKQYKNFACIYESSEKYQFYYDKYDSDEENNDYDLYADFYKNGIYSFSLRQPFRNSGQIIIEFFEQDDKIYYVFQKEQFQEGMISVFDALTNEEVKKYNVGGFFTTYKMLSNLRLYVEGWWWDIQDSFIIDLKEQKVYKIGLSCMYQGFDYILNPFTEMIKNVKNETEVSVDDFIKLNDDIFEPKNTMTVVNNEGEYENVVCKRI